MRKSRGTQTLQKTPGHASKQPGFQQIAFGADGFVQESGLSVRDLATVRALIREQWLQRIQQFAPRDVDEFAALGLGEYHELASKLDHGSLWSKEHRLLPLESVATFKQTEYYQSLNAFFGGVEISDEDQQGWEQVYWRLVRPNCPEDVGPMHADIWFAQLEPEFFPPDRSRLKVWIAIECEPGKNGLAVVPGSHLKDWQFRGELRDNKLKPVIEENVAELDSTLVKTSPGEAIVFDERLLHQGVINRGQRTRVSIEFTILIR